MGGRYLLLRDLQGYFYPWSEYKLKTFASGEFPLWNPYSFYGEPFIANPQTGVFYPPSYIYGLIPFARGITIYVFVHLMIAALGMYWFSRELGLGRAGAALAAICFAFGGWMVKVWEFSSVLGAVSWTPLILALVQRGVKGSYRSLLLMGALVLALQVFAGYPLMVFFTVCAGAWLILVNLIARRRLRRNCIIALASFAAACVLGVLLSLIQLAPTAELASLSPRATDPTYTLSARIFSLHPVELANLVMPYLFGYPDWQKCFYIGLIPVMLAFFGLFSLRWLQRGRRELLAAIVFCLGLIAVALPLALGKYTPFYPFVCRTISPLAGLLTWPSWSMFLAYLSFAMLAGFGLQSLIESRNQRNLLPLFLVLGVFVMAGVVLTVKPTIIQLARARFSTELLAYRNPAIYPMRFPPPIVAAKFLALSVISAAALLISSGLPRAYRIALPLAFAVIDLWTFSSKQVFFAEKNMYAERPKIISSLEGDKDAFRLASSPVAIFLNDLLYGCRSEKDFAAAADLLRADMGLLYGIFRSYGWRALATGETITLSDLLDAGPRDDRVLVNLLRFLNVKYVLLCGVGPQGITTSLASNPSPLPRAFFVPAAKHFPTEKQVLDAMASPGFDPSKEILVSEPVPDAVSEPAPTASPAALVSSPVYTANTVRLQCESQTRGFLFLSDTHYPGWNAYINGQKTRVIKADFAFRAIQVPAGRSEILFSYEPRWLFPVAAITGASWFLVLSLIALTPPRTRTRPGPIPNQAPSPDR